MLVLKVSMFTNVHDNFEPHRRTRPCLEKMDDVIFITMIELKNFDTCKALARFHKVLKSYFPSLFETRVAH